MLPLGHTCYLSQIPPIRLPNVYCVGIPLSRQVWSTEPLPWPPRSPLNPCPGPRGDPLFPLNVKECVFDYDVILLQTSQSGSPMGLQTI